MASGYRNQNLVTILVIITCSATISVLLSLEFSNRHVSVTSMTKCVCSETKWRSEVLEEDRIRREAEGGLVTVQHEEPPPWMHIKRGDLEYPTYSESLAAIQPRRKQHLNNMCHKSLPMNHPHHIHNETLKHLYVNEKYKFVYCSVPKAGCTNWKRVMMAINNSSLDVTSISRDDAHHGNMKTLIDYPEDERKRILSHYQKFLFTRDPFVRLLSAYKDKFMGIRNLECERHSYYFKNIAADIMSRFRKSVSRKTLQNGEGVRWTEFIRYIINTNDRMQLNEHWQSTNSLCAPCSISYDYIGKLETVREDSARLLRRFEIRDKRIFYPKSNNPTRRDSAEFYDAFGTITINELRELWSIYEIDFLLFNYTQPQFLTSSIKEK
ncbi:carbohydrate sulfotransferase 11-like [Lytechinus pictus]|uniref:carbohydrate sulfotransferase 11-like n=1 Tax=Lytechinus pictus TaxID=7653 RepID=UPI00240D7250|nr:carbohydrate sulfotransferase 11-like [Lytechinus pictus]